MPVSSPENSYTLIRSCDGRGTAEQFICRDADGRGRNEYRLVRLPLKKVPEDLYVRMHELRAKGSFHAYREHFTDAKNFYLVVYSGEGTSLDEKLADSEFNFREKVFITEKFLSKLVVEEPPLWFFNACLDTGLIKVTDSLDVNVDYDLSDIYRYDKASFDEGIVLLTDVLEKIFGVELKYEEVPDIASFILELRNGKYENLLEICKAYRRIYENRINNNQLAPSPNSLPFRLWEKAKQMFGLLKNCVFGLIMAVAIIYLVLSIKNFLSEPEKGKGFERIGTLEIINETETVKQNGDAG